MTRMWRPDADDAEASNLARLMRRLGGDPSDYRNFHARTVADPAAYIESAIEDLGWPWRTPPTTILAGWAPGVPLHEARWFRGGTINVSEVAIDHQIRSGRGQQPAVIWEGEYGATRMLTFVDLKREVEATARALTRSGVARGDVVGVMVPTVPEAVVLYYALLRIGACFSPIATDMSAEQVALRLSEAGVTLMVGADGFFARGKQRALKPTIDEACAIHGRIETLVLIPFAGIKGLPMTEERDVLWGDWVAAAAKDPTPAAVAIGPDDLTMVLFSSGTTGKPKGTRHGYAAYLQDMIENAYGSDVRPGDRSFWMTNVGWMMFPWLLAGHGCGATVVLYEGAHDHPGPDRMLRFVADHGVTHMGLSPAPLKALVDTVEAAGGVEGFDLGALRVLRNTGAPLTAALFDRTLDVLGLAVSGAWGGTDGCFCLGGGNPVFPREAASMTPAPGMDVHVMVYDDDTRTYRDAVGDEIGEVVVQTPAPSMTKGLINDPDGSRFLAAYYQPKLEVPEEVVASAGLAAWWFHGDLARLRADGHLWILGRADDLLVVRGTNIDPTSVSNAIADLVEASAPIVTMDGDQSELFVFVVRRAGDKTKPEDLAAAVGKRIRDRVNKRTPPKRVFEVSGIPSTVNNKPQFRLVRDAFQGATIGDTATLRNPEVLDEIRAHGRAHFGR